MEYTAVMQQTHVGYISGCCCDKCANCKQHEFPHYAQCELLLAYYWCFCSRVYNWFSSGKSDILNCTSKVIIVTGSSVLRAVYGSLLRIHTHSGALNTVLCVYMAPLCECKVNLHFLLFVGFGLKIMPQLNIKAVHN